MPLALAIAIHNIPEGISIATSVYFATRSRKKTVWACLLSGLAEPLGAALGYLVLQPFLSPAVFGSVFGVIVCVMVFWRWTSCCRLPNAIQTAMKPFTA